MIVYNRIEDIDIDRGSCVTIGNFDGVHKGHQRLINKTVEYAKKNNLLSVVFTFTNHPVNYFMPGYVKNIMSERDKQRVIESLGVDIYIGIKFDENMTSVSAQEYIENILLGKLKAKNIIVGHDFSFARKKEGTTQTLVKAGEKFNFGVEIVTPVLVDGKRVSSTDIRQLISEGKMKEAEKLLGRNYSIGGNVIRARQIGRTLGFPTANIDYDKKLIIPKIGVYATLAKVSGNIYCGATSVGTNPTVNGSSITIETYILNFDGDIYDEYLTVEFLELMRDEIKFDTKEELIEQLFLDKEYVRKNYINTLKKSLHK
ncbi:bifunctional riboflavin kinase/FAD synthetase [Peptostreptococcus equinus]|uniref:Riboflavin biosynthesis protein n=1 Tax=Peptostreptococcus equinus TaxID=3003601 RepID=A0ABY7JT45_9FIRM|nr:bifunctional riboflavin kinase/FAD synthetase [Peptostreptococcus sp. CBA3647]WAW15646.1 bifunctional riboflavin kinase/FAD synthetase [Peptostreptococcus sp. CBA3647]